MRLAHGSIVHGSMTLDFDLELFGDLINHVEIVQDVAFLRLPPAEQASIMSRIRLGVLSGTARCPICEGAGGQVQPLGYASSSDSEAEGWVQCHCVTGTALQWVPEAEHVEMRRAV